MSTWFDLGILYIMGSFIHAYFINWKHTLPYKKSPDWFAICFIYLWPIFWIIIATITALNKITRK